MGYRTTVFTVAVPGLPSGPEHHRCIICEQLFPMTTSTTAMLTDMRQAKKPYLVICYGCLPGFSYATQELPNEFLGVRSARQQLGL